MKFSGTAMTFNGISCDFTDGFNTVINNPTCTVDNASNKITLENGVKSFANSYTFTIRNILNPFFDKTTVIKVDGLNAFGNSFDSYVSDELVFKFYENNCADFSCSLTSDTYITGEVGTLTFTFTANYAIIEDSTISLKFPKADQQAPTNMLVDGTSSATVDVGVTVPSLIFLGFNSNSDLQCCLR